MFDVRLRLYNPDGTKARVLKTLTFDVTQVDSGTPALNFTTSARVAGFLESPFLVAVEYCVDGGGAWVQPRNGLMIATADENDNADRTGTYSFTAQGFVPWLMQYAPLHWSGSAKDNKRTWTNAPSGQIIWAMITEAKTWGWGPLVTMDFSITKDSNGQNWPAGDKITESYDLLDPLSKTLDSLSSQGLCEWWTEGTLVRLFKPGTGEDKTTIRLGGRGFTRVPMKTDFNGVITHLTVVPEKYRYWVYLTNPGADGRFGRLEGVMTQSGVKDPTTATRLAQPVLTNGRAKKRELSYEWTAAAGMPQPWAEFNIGDQVTVTSRSGKEQLRVIGFVISKDQAGVITCRAVVGSKLQTLTSKLVQRTGAAAIGGTIGGTGSSFPASGVTAMDPAAPGGLHVVSNVGYFGDDGTARAHVELAWNPVDTASDGSALDVGLYEVWARVDPANGSRATASADTDLVIDSWESGVTRKVKVRAQSSNGVWGEFSGEIDVTPAFPVEVPDPPTAPTLTCSKRVVTVKWDGNLTTGAPEPGFDHVVAWATKTGGTFVPVAGAFSRGNVVFDAADLGAAIGDTVEVKLYAVNTLGVSSTGSDVTTITVTGIVGPDLEANSVTANAIAVGAVQAEHVNIGAYPPLGTQVNRVPAPVTDATFWGKVIAGTRPLYNAASARQNVAATTGGIVLTPTSTDFARIGASARLPVPATRKVHLRWLATGPVRAQVFTFDAAGTYIGAPNVIAASGSVILTLPDTAALYYSSFSVDAGGSPATLLMAEAFEVIGTGDLQHIEMSPQGLALFDATGTPAVQLSTATDTLLTINKQSPNGDTVPVAMIDSDGNGAFQSLDMSGEISFPSGDLLGAFGDITYNGQSIDTPFLERYPRGIIYAAGLGVDSAGRLYVSNSNQYQALGSGQVVFDAGRQYVVGFDSVFIRRWLASGGTSSLVLEVWIGSAAQNVASPNQTNGTLLRWSMLESDNPNNQGLSSGVQESRPIVLSGTKNILVRLSNPGTRQYEFYNLDVEPNLVIQDVGPVIDATDGGSIKSRAASGGVSPVNPQPTTTIFNATWSALWDSGGTKLGNGSSLYADGRLVQGGNTGSRAGQIGFPALGLSGRSIKGMWIRLRNRHTGIAGGVTFDLGTHGNASAPSGSAPNCVNPFTSFTAKGQDKWHPIPSSLWAGFAAGTYRGIQIGGPNVNNGGGDYAIFDGYSTTNAATSAGVRPQLKVSYR